MGTSPRFATPQISGLPLEVALLLHLYSSLRKRPGVPVLDLRAKRQRRPAAIATVLRPWRRRRKARTSPNRSGAGVVIGRMSGVTWASPHFLKGPLKRLTAASACNASPPPRHLMRSNAIPTSSMVRGRMSSFRFRVRTRFNDREVNSRLQVSNWLTAGARDWSWRRNSDSAVPSLISRNAASGAIPEDTRR